VYRFRRMYVSRKARDTSLEFRGRFGVARGLLSHTHTHKFIVCTLLCLGGIRCWDGVKAARQPIIIRPVKPAIQLPADDNICGLSHLVVSSKVDGELIHGTQHLVEAQG
jgi:hypothetical protein